MSEKSFARVGHYKDGVLVLDTLRARDVEASNGVNAETHILESGIHLTAEQATLIANAIQASEKAAANGVATLDANGKIPAGQLDLGAYQTSANVVDYAAMLALSPTQAKVNTFVFVADATGDTTVKTGWASYKRVATSGNASDYVKVAEGESLDISFPEMEQGIQEAKSAAQTADGKAVAAANEAAKLDFTYCASESELAGKNLRNGAMVLMAVDND